MRRVVISQPMYFPWVGMLEQIRQADVYVHYDDVQFSKGSFTNRVQLKTPKGPEWMTLPIRDLHLGQHIRDVKLDHRQDWQSRHLSQFHKFYRDARYYQEAATLLESVVRSTAETVSEIAIKSLQSLCQYFEIGPALDVYSSQLGIGGESSRRVLDVVHQSGGSTYITGHGAKNYLDHELFERESVQVEYMVYERRAYPQLHGPFDPHVTALDLIANCGKSGLGWICSRSEDWRTALKRDLKV